MRTITVSEGQTLLDIAMQEGGDVSSVATIAALNNKALTDELKVGEQLLVPDDIKIEYEPVVDIFKERYRKPASGANNNDGDIGAEGIEFWGIEIDFIVS